MSEKKATVKFNGGALAILCTRCRKMLKAGREITSEDMDKIFPSLTLEAQYCETCKPKKK